MRWQQGYTRLQAEMDPQTVKALDRHGSVATFSKARPGLIHPSRRPR